MKRKQIIRKLFQNIRILGVNHIMNKTEIKEEQAIYMDLYEKLKSMKFSGMAEELRLQLENPNSDLESFQDRFEKLVTAEWNLRYNKKFERYLKKAKLKIPGTTFDEKLYDTDRQLDIPTIEKLNTCIWIDEGRNLVVTGMTGTGKTYYVNALAVAALKQFKEVRYYSASKLLLELSAHEQVEDSIKFLGIMENIAQVDLLIIDDFGLMNLDVEKCRHLFEILDSRERRKSTVIVSQIPVKEWYDLFKDCTYADACLDRVLCKAYRLEFKGESLRNQKF